MNAKLIIDAALGQSDYSCHTDKSGSVWCHDSDGNLHCSDGPAIRIYGGADYWYKHGKVHRLGGPAVVQPDGICTYWVNNRRFTEEEFYRYVDQDTGEVLAPPGKKLTYD